MPTGRLVGPGGTGGGGPVGGAAIGARPEGAVGVPSVRLTGRVTRPQAEVHVEVVDVAPDGRRVTVNDQTMPVRLSGGRVDRGVTLHGVAWMVEPGHALEVEVTTGSAQYPPPRTGPYAVELTARVVLPVTAA